MSENDQFGPGGCGEKFYDLSERDTIREVSASEAYEYGSDRGRFLIVSYQGGEFPTYRAPLPEHMDNLYQIEKARLLIEDASDEPILSREAKNGECK